MPLSRTRSVVLGIFRWTHSAGPHEASHQMELSVQLGSPIALVCHESENPCWGSTSERGVTWIELTLDFEIATRVCLTGYGAQQHQNLNPWQMNTGGPKRTRQRVEGMGDTDVAQRSLNF